MKKVKISFFLAISVLAGAMGFTACNENEDINDLRNAGPFPIYTPESFVDSELYPGTQYINNMIIILTERDVSIKKVEKAAKDIDGIVTHIGYLDKYYIQVPESNENELIAMCEKLSAKYSKYFISVSYDIVENDGPED